MEYRVRKKQVKLPTHIKTFFVPEYKCDGMLSYRHGLNFKSMNEALMQIGAWQIVDENRIESEFVCDEIYGVAQ